MSRLTLARPCSSRLHRAAELGVGAALLAAWFLTLAPTSIGGPATYVVVRGDSMLPTYHSGGLVLLHAATTYASGDAVGYRVPAGEVGAGLIVLHRIVDGDSQRGFVMQGDNNPAPDPWHPRLGDVAGVARAQIPALGRLVAFLHQPATAGALAAAMVVGVLVGRRPRRRVASDVFQLAAGSGLVIGPSSAGSPK